MIDTAGAFNRDDRNIYFTAAQPITQRDGVKQHAYVLTAVNDLMNNKIGMQLFENWLDSGVCVMLDSGVFNLSNEHMRAHPGMTMDQALALAPDRIDGFQTLLDFYIKIAREYGDRVWGYVEVDQGGRDNKRITRNKLLDLGLRPIPVYHPFNDGWDYFDELAEGFDRICFGNVVQASRPERQRLLATAWERHRRYPGLWIHMLGLTPNEWLLAMPCDSADSSSWISGIRYGQARDAASLHSFGDMPGFHYERGSDPESDGGSHKAVALGALTSAMLMRNWRTHMRALRETFGMPLYPTVLDAEPPLR